MTEEPPGGMGRCSVTGKVYPADELITLHGNLVGAEGKAYLVERLKTGEDITPKPLPRITIGKRTGAMISDGVFLMVVARVINFVIPYSQPELLLTVMAIVGLFYFAEMHAWHGWTLGKMGYGLRVVSLNGSAVSRSAAYVRTLVLGWPILLCVAAAWIGDRAIGNISIGLTLTWFAISGALAWIDSASQLTLHDRIAGTRIDWRYSSGRAVS